MDFKIKYLNLTYFLLNLVFIFPTIVFGRTFMGLKIINFRIGEIIVGISLFLTIFFVFNRKKIKIYFGQKVYRAYILLNIFVVIPILIPFTNLLNSYTFQSSSYIWLMSFIFFNKYFHPNLNISKKYIFSLNMSLLTVYYFSVINFPKFLATYFLKNSDKFDYLKASEILLIFVIVVYLNNRYLSKFISFSFVINTILFSLFAPLIIFKSRGAALAFFIFIIFEIFSFKKSFKFTKMNLLGVFVICPLIFMLSARLVTDVEPDESQDLTTNDIVGSLFDEKNTSINTIFSFYMIQNIDDLKSFNFINKGRLFSADGNINWRLQIWQDVILDSFDEFKYIYGSGYKEIIPAMNNPLYRGADGTNEYVHNYLINIYARGGLLQLGAILYFYYQLLKTSKYKFNKKNLLNYFLPLLVVSLFDSSMSSPQFPFLFFLFYGQNLIMIDE